jgi:hypothetical protein
VRVIVVFRTMSRDVTDEARLLHQTAANLVNGNGYTRQRRPIFAPGGPGYAPLPKYWAWP